MKKILFVFCVIVCVTGPLAAEDVAWGSMYQPFNMRLEADAAFERSGSGNQLAIYPEIEMLLWKPIAAEVAFIDVGAVVKGRFGVPLSLGSQLTAGAGLLGSVHLGFRGFDFTGAEYLSKLDVFAELGLGVDIIPFDIGLAAKTGLNYFITDSVAVGAFYSNWIGSSGGGLSISLKIGETPKVKGINFEMPETAAGFAVEPYLLQFYTLYYSANYAGGFYPDNFNEGQGVAYRITSIDGSDTISYDVEKALLKELDDGFLWSLNYSDEDDSFYYEYITDSDYYVKTVYFKPDGEDVLTFDAGKAANSDAKYLTWEDYQAEGTTGVSIDVEAGRFLTTEYSYVDETGVDVKWWLTDKVPGKLVSYKMENGSEIVISELIDLSRGNKPVLYK